ncbi:C-GCAxxG-C-C family protein [Barnesiella viscericola]|uniref:C-GCAxxG-C-C family protein n=1 Tax=Barnesiella viscericola TaxID=397865 RepID=UPI00235777CC|nr:C-GCAxxG-C-C family protein [Barnesiella viscericola]
MEKINVEERAEKARQLFHEGYNCAQSVVMAYIDLFDIDPASAASISAPLGGGMGRLREVCGAVSGMFMIAGLYYKNDVPSDMAKRKQVYATVQELAEQSKALNGSIICRELLGLDHKSDAPTPEARTEAYYKRRPCADYVASAARLIGEKLNQEISKE